MICSFCCTDADHDDLPVAIAKIAKCVNCVIDIKTRGGWSGYGWEAIQKLIARFGEAAIWAEVNKQGLIKGDNNA